MSIWELCKLGIDYEGTRHCPTQPKGTRCMWKGKEIETNDLMLIGLHILVYIKTHMIYPIMHEIKWHFSLLYLTFIKDTFWNPLRSSSWHHLDLSWSLTLTLTCSPLPLPIWLTCPSLEDALFAPPTFFLILNLLISLTFIAKCSETDWGLLHDIFELFARI